MNSFVIIAVFSLAALANCEAPGYNYRQPSQSSVGSGVSSGGQSFGGGSSSGGLAFGGSGGGYQQEAVGGNTNEGQNIDPQLLDQIRQILLKEESQNGGGGSNGGGRAPSSSYGAPQAQYGPPQQAAARVVGIILENSIPSIQVAQYRQSSSSGSAGGYASSQGGYPSGPSSFGVAPQVQAPSSNYGAPAQRPSSNYGAPF